MSYRGNENEAMDNCKSVRALTLRERLEARIMHAKRRMEEAQEDCQEAEEALELLKKNRQLEILANMLTKFLENICFN